MGIVIQSVANYAPWIYAICGLVALYQLYKIWLVRSERKQAVFSLEREKAVRDTYNILAIALTLLMTMGFTYFISTTLAQAVGPLVLEALVPTPALPFQPTPTNTPLSVTPTPTWTVVPGSELIVQVPEGTVTDDPATEEDESLGEGESTGEGTLTPEVTPIPEVQETPTPTPLPAPVVVAPNCPDQRSLLIRPGANEVVSGGYNVVGSATHESFQFYKIEVAPGANASGNWEHKGGQSVQVVNNLLATVDTTSMSNGLWSLRLVVVDQTGNFPPPCQVTITVQN